MREAAIVSTARTPIGKAFRGAFNDTHGADDGRARHRARGEAQRARSRRDRGRDPRLRASPKARPATTSRASPRFAPGLPVTIGGHDDQPLLQLRPAGDRVRRAARRRRRRAGAGRRRARVDQPRAAQREPHVLARRVSRRAQARPVHVDDRDGRRRREALRRQPRAAGRVLADQPAAHGGGAAGRALRRGDRAAADAQGGAEQRDGRDHARGRRRWPRTRATGPTPRSKGSRSSSPCAARISTSPPATRASSPTARRRAS